MTHDLPYVAGSIPNLVARLREARDGARIRNRHAPNALRDAVLWDGDPVEWNVAGQIEVLCSRLTEAIDLIEQQLIELAPTDQVTEQEKT